jgi:RNA polymerase sigma-70 factor (sigma-E family)
MSERDQAFVEFVETANPSLRRTAYLISGNRHTADDIVQDALYKLYLAWPKMSKVGNPFAYARRMVVNAAYDGGRRPWRREVAKAEVPDVVVDDFATGHARRDEVLEALRTLAPRQRACVVLRYYEDLSVEETAEILGCAEGTVKSQA